MVEIYRSPVSKPSSSGLQSAISAAKYIEGLKLQISSVGQEHQVCRNDEHRSALPESRWWRSNTPNFYTVECLSVCLPLRRCLRPTDKGEKATKSTRRDARLALPCGTKATSIHQISCADLFPGLVPICKQSLCGLDH